MKIQRNATQKGRVPLYLGRSPTIPQFARQIAGLGYACYYPLQTRAEVTMELKLRSIFWFPMGMALTVYFYNNDSVNATLALLAGIIFAPTWLFCWYILLGQYDE